MTRLVPIIGPAFTYKDVSAALLGAFDKALPGRFESAMSSFTGTKHVHITNSGISAFYIVLKALRKRSGKTGVILPAYTAGSLVAAVIKAGFKPVLCDISLEDFNLDTKALLNTVTRDTLAVVGVHMFGIGIEDMDRLKSRMPSEVFLIEDCAQAMGTEIDGRRAGTFGDVSFFSFNRGKNLSAFGGGAVAIAREDLAEGIRTAYEEEVEPFCVCDCLGGPVKALAFLLAAQPSVYKIGHGVISRFKDVSPSKDFLVEKNCPFQTALGMILLERMEQIAQDRFEKGMFLIKGLKDSDNIILPGIRNGMRAAFNRLPVIFKEPKQAKEAICRLAASGIEASRMYGRPLHHMFDLGYKNEDLPNARYLAERLLTLPVHPGVGERDLSSIVEVIRKL